MDLSVAVYFPVFNANIQKDLGKFELLDDKNCQVDSKQIKLENFVV